MKLKLFFIPLLAVCAIIAIVSCTSDNEMSTTTNDIEQTEMKSLASSLESYSKDFLASRNLPQNAPRKIKLTWGKLWECVKADFCAYSDAGGNRHGYLSIGASIEKWKKIKERERNAWQQWALTAEEVTKVENEIQAYKQAYLNDTTNFGALHNATVLHILLTSNFQYNNRLELAGMIIDAVQSFGIEPNGVTAGQVAADMDMFFNEIYSDDTNVMYNRLMTKYPDKKGELQILNQFMNSAQYLSSDDEIQAFTDGYIEIINDSHISKTAKIVLNSNLTIAPNSHFLWNGVNQPNPPKMP